VVRHQLAGTTRLIRGSLSLARTMDASCVRRGPVSAVVRFGEAWLLRSCLLELLGSGGMDGPAAGLCCCSPQLAILTASKYAQALVPAPPPLAGLEVCGNCRAGDRAIGAERGRKRFCPLYGFPARTAGENRRTHSCIEPWGSTKACSSRAVPGRNLLV